MAIEITLKSPKDYTQNQLAQIHELLLAGGQVSPENLHSKIANCFLIATANENAQIIAIAAIKQPSAEYRDYIKQKAQIPDAHQIPKLELGYAYTHPEHRNQGLNRSLTTQLLTQLTSQKIFATTGHDRLKTALTKASFKQIGKNYIGKYNNNISYFEK